jgi:hypothetical protein
MSAITSMTNPQPHLDVEFFILNDLAGRLRAAGAKIKVKKIGKLHRITLLEQPQIATVQQILSYANQTEIAPAITATQTNDNKGAESNISTTTLVVESEPEQTQISDSHTPALATLDDLKALSLKKLQELAALNKIKGRTKIKPDKLTEKLHGLVTKDQL